MVYLWCACFVVVVMVAAIHSSHLRAKVDVLSSGCIAIATLAFRNAANQAMLREHGACKGVCVCVCVCVCVGVWVCVCL